MPRCLDFSIYNPYSIIAMHSQCLTDNVVAKVIFFVQCIKKQLIIHQNFNIQTSFSQFLWFFSLKFGFKGQMVSRIHLILSDAYKLTGFDRNISGNRNVKFLECNYLLVQQCVKLTLHKVASSSKQNRNVMCKYFDASIEWFIFFLVIYVGGHFYIT